MMLYCLPNVVLAFTSSPAVAVAAQVARGAGTLIVDVLAMTALQRAVAPDVTARVFGVFWALIVGAIALGALIAPPVVGLLGLDPAIVVLALGPALLSLAAYPALAQMDRASAVRTALYGARVAVLEATGLFGAAPRPVLERLAAGVERDRRLRRRGPDPRGRPRRRALRAQDGRGRGPLRRARGRDARTPGAGSASWACSRASRAPRP